MAKRNYSDQLMIAASQKVKEREYWLSKLSGELPKSSFYPDYTTQNSPGPGAVKFNLYGELYLNLMKLCSNSDHTLHMALLAGVTVLLSRYTGSSDIILGSPIYKQDQEEEFINTILPLRNRVEKNMTFKELLLQVRQTVLEATEHYSYPMEILAEELNLPLTGKDPAFLDTFLLLENIHDRKYLKSLKANVTFCFSRTDSRIDAVLEYNNGLYDEVGIEKISRYYVFLLEQLLLNMDRPIASIGVISEEEKRQILFEFNNTGAGYPKDKTVSQLFEEQAARTPGKVAALFRDQQVSYGELNQRANQLAGMLRSKGIKPGKTVAVIFEPSLERIIVLLGIMKARGICVPIDPEYPEKRILSILTVNRVSLVLTDDKTLRRLDILSLQDIYNIRVQPVVTAPRPPIENLDILPPVDRTLVDYEKYHQHIGLAMGKHTISLQATRGCPYHCAFCHKIWPKKHTTRSAEHILKEIRNCCNAGVKRFVIIDDIFNLDVKNSTRLLEGIIKEQLGIQLFFPNGLRGDILTREFIDLMVEAGTVNVDMALETASPRMQKLIKKNLNLEKFRENVLYFAQKYPHVMLELEMIIGFPTETEEEALMTLDFLKSVKWFHFPNLNILKVYPNTDMHRLALEHGITEEAIERSTKYGYHELPDTLPFPKEFVTEFQSRFLSEYLMSKERLLHVLPYQARNFTKDEIVLKYDSYFPTDIKKFSDILELYDISGKELGDICFLPGDYMAAPGFKEKIKQYFPVRSKNPDALKILLIDLSMLFSPWSRDMLYDVVEAPLGLMHLASYLKERFGSEVDVKVLHSRINFDSYRQLQTIIAREKPHLVGLRTLSLYKDFLHTVVSLLRQWGFAGPIISGGPYATSDYQLILQDTNLNLAVFGEGEITCAELVEKMLENNKKLPEEKTLQEIKGIAYIREKDKPRLKEGKREVLILEEVWKQLDRYPRENLDCSNQGSDLVYLISTSGSTGEPKSVMLEHRNLVNLLHFEKEKTGIDFSGRILQFFSIGFDASFNEIFSVLLHGGQVMVISAQLRNDMMELFDFIRRNDIDIVFLPPSLLKLIFSDEAFVSAFPGSVRHIVSTGEQLIIPELLKKYLKEKQVYLHNHYGPSETHVVTALILDPQGEIPGLPSIGKPISNTRILILDENRNMLPIGAVGELVICGDSVGPGYFNRPDLTAEKFIELNDPAEEMSRKKTQKDAKKYFSSLLAYRTGDLARWLPDGNIQFLGRRDHQVKIRGFRVELGEIENRMLSHKLVSEAVVLPWQMPNGDNYFCAYYVPVPGETASPHNLVLTEYLAEELPDYMVPSYFIPLSHIPLNSNGKVDRKALPEPRAGIEESYHPPENNLEQQLTEIWAEVLGIEPGSISTDANFFKLGGYSLKATLMAAKIFKELQVKIPLAKVFDMPTIKQLAVYIKERAEDGYAEVSAVEEREYYELSYNQKRLWIAYLREPGSPAYHLGGRGLLPQPVDPGVIKKVLYKLMDRHESLRTGFRIIGDEPIQVVKESSEVEISLQVIDISQITGEEKAQEWDRVFQQAVTTPFDLSTVPLVRALLLILDEEKCDLIITMHHIISDGWSLEMLQREFSGFYNESLTGETFAPEPLKLQYKDFAHWQNKQIDDPLFRNNAHQYWKNKLQGGMPRLELPVDFAGDKNDKRCEVYRCAVDNDLKEKLQKLAKSYDTTLFTVLFCAYNILLAHFSGQDEIVCSIVISGRDHPLLNNIVGYFVNSILFKVGVNHEEGYTDLLQRIKSDFQEALRYQQYAVELVLGELKMKYPDFSVSFNMLNIQEGTTEQEIKSFEPGHSADIILIHFDAHIELYACEYKNGIELNWRYRKAFFKPETIEKAAGGFLKLCRYITEDQEES